ncbi:hypothetical protein [Sphingobacterium sp. CZ-UAM]|uniref:hypothetical protein n=1 Tax=Sphingobacterium sp. CZ-UAM TaxID=1933868 RepID=UPI001C379F91|nr:hypothetical protein [Sphingobacterium sp. CZ-UAM]
MKIAAEKIVPIDFDSEELPYEIRELRPVVFKEETSYWCLLGPDVETGILGNGETVSDAFEDWLKMLRKRLKSTDDRDEVANFIRDSLTASNRKIW